MTNVPKAFQDLLLKSGPKVLVEGLKLFGTREIVGPQHSPQIMSWKTKLGMGNDYIMDETPWCGLYVAVVVFNAGYKPVAGALGARNWAKWGVHVEPTEAALGDVLVFVRPGGGHVGFYVGENASHYFVLGGNQGNCVCIVMIEKSRRIAVRRSPWKQGQPADVVAIWRKEGGVAASQNEA